MAVPSTPLGISYNGLADSPVYTELAASLNNGRTDVPDPFAKNAVYQRTSGYAIRELVCMCSDDSTEEILTFPVSPGSALVLVSAVFNGQVIGWRFPRSTVYLKFDFF